MSDLKPHVFASRRAVRRARTLGLLPPEGTRTVGEDAEALAALVRALVREGSVAVDRSVPAGRGFLVFADGWLAHCEKKPLPARPSRSYWSVVAVEPHTGGKITPRPRSRPDPPERHLGAHGAHGEASLEERLAELLART